MSVNCYYCGIETIQDTANRKGRRQPPNKRTRDHLVPKVRGGKCTPHNTVIACERCNQDKGQLTYEEYQIVLKFRRGEILT